MVLMGTDQTVGSRRSTVSLHSTMECSHQYLRTSFNNLDGSLLLTSRLVVRIFDHTLTLPQTV